MGGACDGNAVIPGAQSARTRNDELPIQRLVLPENPVLVERDPSIARQIRLDVRPRRDAVAQLDEAGNFLLERLLAFWKGVALPFPNLKQREADGSQAAVGGVGASICSP